MLNDHMVKSMNILKSVEFVDKVIIPQSPTETGKLFKKPIFYFLWHITLNYLSPNC